MEQITGFIESIVFVNPENGFTVAKLKEPKKKELTAIIGIMPSLQAGETVTCKGEWKKHPQHGMQFEILSCDATKPQDIKGIQKYLESGLIKGIGPAIAKKIVSHFKEKTLDIIDSTPEKLLAIPGIKEKKLENIVVSWEEQRAIRDVMIFLRSFDVSPAYAHRIYKTYREKTIEKVKENPYQLAKDVFGIGFKIADTIAQKIGIDKNSPFRLEAGLIFSLQELAEEGHTCFPKAEFLKRAVQILEVAETLVYETLETMIKDKKVVFSDPMVALPFLAFFENNIACDIARLKNPPALLRDVNIEKALSWVEKKLNITLADKQKEAVQSALKEKVHIITGGPGTGKSTITNAILRIYQQLTDRIILAAPTGKAAKRMSQITGKKAFTIHALLEFDFTNGGFKKNKEHKLKGDLFIIDEVSMLDTQLAYHLLQAIPTKSKLIFIGDVDQLPSVGPGNILKDLIASQTVGITRLTEIFRQAKGSHIILNAHRINKGHFPFLSPSAGSDFRFFEALEKEEVFHRLLRLTTKEIPSLGFNPYEEVQVLSPIKKGVIGIENLNFALQDALNPSDKQLLWGGKRFREKDKVMQIKNNYDKEVFNGDVGRIKIIDSEEQKIFVNYDGKEVAYDFLELDEIQLAYAVSVHKFQGSESPCIVMPIHTSHFKFLYRNLLYTAVTRGKKLVCLVGTKQAIAICINNTDVNLRFTGLKESLIKTKEKEDTFLSF